MSSTSSLLVCLALLFAASTIAKDNWETKVDEQGKQVQSLQIQAPSMTEEDQYGYTMPEQYRCDSCKVVAHHLTEALKRRQPKNRRLQEWEYHELFDETCASGFSGYGVALVNGQNVLSGPALKRDNLEPGMGAIQMGGETWEKRLGEICRKFVYEKVGEDEVHEYFHSHGEVSSDLCFRETRDCRVGAEPPQKKKAKKSTGEKKPKRDKSDTKVVDAKGLDIDVSTFVAKMAKQHGLPRAEYTKKRSFADWEAMFVLAGQRISEKQHTKVVEV